MERKTLCVYMQDETYEKILCRYLNSMRYPGLSIERMTEREAFWQSIKKHNDNTFWLTDENEDTDRVSDKEESLMIMSEVSDPKRHRISFLQTGDVIADQIRVFIGIANALEAKDEGPARGIYGFYSPWGEYDAITAALFSQELSVYGSTLYVNLSAFPHFFTSVDETEPHALGELFFRLEQTAYGDLVRQAMVPYGSAMRLPGVSHYRDLWDISEEDYRLFLERLASDCGFKYVVVVFNDIREALPMTLVCNRFYLVGDKIKEENTYQRFDRYLKTEKISADIQITKTEFPDEAINWGRDLSDRDIGTWLEDPIKKSFVRRLWGDE